MYCVLHILKQNYVSFSLFLVVLTVEMETLCGGFQISNFKFILDLFNEVHTRNITDSLLIVDTIMCQQLTDIGNTSVVGHASREIFS